MTGLEAEERHPTDDIGPHPTQPLRPAPPRLRPATAAKRRPGSKLLVLVCAVAAALLASGLALALDRGATPRNYAHTFQVDRATLDGVRFGKGFTFRVSGGSFAVRGEAATGFASGQTPAFATIRVGTDVRAFSTSFIRVRSGSGIVFHFVDANNYWSVVASPEFGTWNVSKTVQGQTTFVANTGNNLYQNDTLVGLRTDGDQVTVLIDGKPSMRVADRTFATVSRVGLILSPGDNGETRWQRIDVTT